MNKVFALILATFLTTALPAGAEIPSPVEKDVQIGLSGVYVPGGITTRSEAFVVASGVFQNACYRWKTATVTHKDGFNHEIKAYATVSSGMCLMVLVPFQKEIKLGTLEVGTHVLRFDNGDGTYLEKNLTVQ